MASSDNSDMDRAKAARRTLLLIIIIAIAAALRLSSLGRQPLWLDEATDASFAARPFWDCLFAEHVHPPLYRTLLHFVVLEFGDSAAAVRFLPALFGILTIPATWLLARRLVPKTELMAAALVAASPFLVFFSQENRNYSLFILLAVLASWAFVRFQQERRGLALYCVLAILLLYTHYLALLVLLAHEVVYWWHLRYRVFDWMLNRLAIFVAFLPWVLWMEQQYRNESRLFMSVTLLIPMALLRFLLGFGVAVFDATRLTENLWTTVAQETAFLVPSLALFGWLLWRGLWRVSAQREGRILFAAILFIPWTVLLLLAPWLQLASERYLAFQAPFVLLLVAVGLCSLQRLDRIFASLAVAVVVGFSLFAYYGAPGSAFGYRFRFAKENWPEAASLVRQQRADTVIIAPGYLKLALDRYPLGTVRAIPMSADSSVPLDLKGDLKGARRVALVTARSGQAEERLRAELDASYPRIAEEVFLSQNSIRVAVYEIAHRPELPAKK